MGEGCQAKLSDIPLHSFGRPPGLAIGCNALFSHPDRPTHGISSPHLQALRQPTVVPFTANRLLVSLPGELRHLAET